jgi:hypothetical protein
VTDQPENPGELAEDADPATKVTPVPEEPVPEEPAAQEPIPKEPLPEEPAAEEAVREEPVSEDLAAEEPTVQAEPDAPAEPDQASQGGGWRTRKDVSHLREVDGRIWETWDRGDNPATRLPDDEEIHLAGLVVAEAFTPATAPALYRALASFPAPEDRKKEWADRVTRGRSAVGMAGSVRLGRIRRTGNQVPGLDLIDPTLPPEVEEAWAYLFVPTPSVTVLVTTFTLTDEAGNLSPLLCADYQSEAYDVRVCIPGRLGRIRARIPWWRPKNYRVSYSSRTAEDKKRQACDSLIFGYEKACQIWLAARFPGTFSTARLVSRPLVRLLLTKKTVPFDVTSPRWLGPPRLGFGPDVWRSTSQPGWAIRLNSGSPARQFTATAAARRRDIALEHAPEGQGESTPSLTAQFAFYQSTFVARWAIACLLSLYTDRLAGLRDRPVRRRLRRPVREALNLDSYLLGDGLDTSTVTADVRDLTENPAYFEQGMPVYIEDVHYANSRAPQELAPWLLDRLKHRGLGLERDADVSTRNISASAGLRQAIANTRLQRTTLLLTTIAIAIAVISLFVAVHASHTTGAKTSPPSHPPATTGSGTAGSTRPARR